MIVCECIACLLHPGQQQEGGREVGHVAAIAPCAYKIENCDLFERPCKLPYYYYYYHIFVIMYQDHGWIQADNGDPLLFLGTAPDFGVSEARHGDCAMDQEQGPILAGR